MRLPAAPLGFGPASRLAATLPPSPAMIPPPLPPAPSELIRKVQLLEQQTSSNEHFKPKSLAFRNYVDCLLSQLHAAQAAASNCDAFEVRAEVAEAKLARQCFSSAQILDHHAHNREIDMRDKRIGEMHAELSDLREVCGNQRADCEKERALRIDVQSCYDQLQVDIEAEKVKHEEVRRLHESVAEDKALLQSAYQALQDARDAERRAQDDLEHKHQAVVVESYKMQIEMERLRAAHDAELHCSRDDATRMHQLVEQEAERLRIEAQRLEAARDAEKRSRKDAERKHRVVIKETEKTQADYLELREAHENERKGREEEERLHRKTATRLEELHRTERRTCEEAELRHASAEALAEQLRHDHDQFRTVATADRERLQEEHAQRMKTAVAAESKRLHVELANARNLLAGVEAERDKLAADVVELRQTANAAEQHFRENRSLRQSLDKELASVGALQRQLESVTSERQTCLEKIKAFEDQVRDHGDKLSQATIYTEDLRRRAINLEAAKDELESDKAHFVRAMELKEEAERDLRRSLEEERAALLEERQASALVQSKLETVTLELGARMDQIGEFEAKIIAHDDLHRTRDYDSQELKQRLADAEAKRDELAADNVHLQRMQAEKDQAEKSLRVSLDTERRELGVLKVSLETANAEVTSLKARRRLSGDGRVADGVKDHEVQELRRQRDEAVDAKQQALAENDHLKRMHDQRCEAEQNLRESLAEEQAQRAILLKRIESLMAGNASMIAQPRPSLIDESAQIQRKSQMLQLDSPPTLGSADATVIVDRQVEEVSTIIHRTVQEASNVKEDRRNSTRSLGGARLSVCSADPKSGYALEVEIDDSDTSSISVDSQGLPTHGW